MKSYGKWIRSLVVCLLAIVLAHPVLAEENQAKDYSHEPWERAALYFGAYIAAVDSSLSLVSPSRGVDVTIDGEDALGLDDTVVSPRVEGFWRIARRHRIDFAWYDLSRDAKETLLIDIPDYPIGTTIKTNFDLQIFRVSYGYSVYKDEHYDLGISAGIFGVDLDFKISATDIGKNETEFTFPLPVIGLRGNFAITDKWFIRQGMDFFFVKVNDYEGHVFDVYGALEYNFWKYAGVGVGFDYVIADVQATDEDFLNEVQMSYAGVLLYGKLFF